MNYNTDPAIWDTWRRNIDAAGKTQELDVVNGQVSDGFCVRGRFSTQSDAVAVLLSAGWLISDPSADGRCVARNR